MCITLCSINVSLKIIDFPPTTKRSFAEGRKSVYIINCFPLEEKGKILCSSFFMQSPGRGYRFSCRHQLAVRCGRAYNRLLTLTGTSDPVAITIGGSRFFWRSLAAHRIQISLVQLLIKCSFQLSFIQCARDSSTFITNSTNWARELHWQFPQSVTLRVVFRFYFRARRRPYYDDRAIKCAQKIKAENIRCESVMSFVRKQCFGIEDSQSTVSIR